MEGRFCNGGHRLHVADVAVVPADGKVWILAICLDCGKGFANSHVVAAPMSAITALSIEKEKTNEPVCK